MKHSSVYIGICAAALACTAFTVTADVAELSQVELLGKKYYVYKAKNGDSLFGIARKFGWDDKTLIELNPSAVSPLKKGMLIYYPTGEKIEVAGPVEKIYSERTELKHTVKRGETVYSIAKMYNLPVEKIYKLNPTSRDGIKAGESLLIRKADQINTADNSTGSVFYTVKSGDTLYSLAQRFGVSVEALMQNNPGVNENNFRAGSTVKIPTRGTGMKIEKTTVEKVNVDSVVMDKAKKNDTWESLASRNGVSEEVLKQANPEVKKLKKNDYVAVPKVEVVTEEKEIVATDPRETTPEGIEEIYQDVHKINTADNSVTETVKVALVADNYTTKKDKEFMRGFLAGIDKQKNNGYKIELKVISAEEGDKEVTAQLNEFEPSMVFTTSDTKLDNYIVDFAQDTRTPVINTFDVKSNAYADNPYVIQLLTPPSLFNDNVAHYAYRRFGLRTLIFVGDEDKNDQLAESLYTVWDPARVKSFASVDALIPEMLTSDGSYLIYSYDTKKADVSRLLESVANLKEQMPLADISLLGRPNLIVYEESMPQELKKASTSIPSRFYIDRDSREYKEFLARYKQLYGGSPAKSLPLYAAVGYDTANYFIPSMASNHGDINNFKASQGTVQSDFELVRPSNWSGFLNPPVYMIDYTSYGTIEKNVISYAE